ncbi:3(2),5-bisphosphate nucleotidase HAL2 [Lindgomyces ingoldianus]|uniref:3(2),5-bisphosphate nucleotidase HAL2 n=1 Tax=Lindgomyces ingoldianus TaxID=673940 RepID=A0ACB6QQI9_9PLEO|nr:3(2),5-bisphosphate nucleotidase HAL2 [Lindgomyces ingoldianus]KAF2468552.1 3(2),5-bisphosphate nucleotidase HAL2 [Lindgomyces ingoldianus]
MSSVYVPTAVHTGDKLKRALKRTLDDTPRQNHQTTIDGGRRMFVFARLVAYVHSLVPAPLYPAFPPMPPSSLQLPIYLLLSLLILAISFIPISTLLSRSFSRLSQISSHLRPAPAFPSCTAPPLATNRTFSTMAYEKELHTALLAVQRATLLTKSVFSSHSKGTLSKSDSSPVTIGDFGAQALIIASIKHVFPDDEVVGEEDADDLRSNSSLRDLVWDLVQSTKLEDSDAETAIGGPVATVEGMLDAIDGGRSRGGREGRIWALDPIDGTKGFLRGGQYAVCLALMVDGIPTVGVIGCPNLPVDDTAPLDSFIGTDADDKEGKGVLFGAVKGEGSTSRPLSNGALQPPTPIKMKPLEDISQATFCESVEAGHSSHGDNAAIASKLGITKPSVRMDSQAKYGSIARGAGDLYLRLPVSKTYEEKIWDHAAGVVIVQEAGGKVTDAWGKPLDFGIGRTLKENKGVVAAPNAIFPRVIDVVKEVLSAKQ